MTHWRVVTDVSRSRAMSGKAAWTAKKSSSMANTPSDAAKMTRHSRGSCVRRRSSVDTSPIARVSRPSHRGFGQSSGGRDISACPMDAKAAILDAVDRVASGRDDALVIHAAQDPNAWVQVSRVQGESALLCEAVGDEYLGRHRELRPAAVEKLQTLGWRDVPAADFTLWVDADTPEQRDQLAVLLQRTLVEVLGHDPAAAPVVAAP